MIVNNFICSVCGKKTLDLSPERIFVDNKNILCIEQNDKNYGFRTIFTCANIECKAHGKGFWNSSDGTWFSYESDDDRLVGLPLYKCRFKFGEEFSPANLFLGDYSWKEYSSKYYKGAYIGENWKSELWRIYGLIKFKIICLGIRIRGNNNRNISRKGRIN